MNKFLCGLTAVLLLLSLMFCCIDVICFDKDFYASEYSRLNTADYVDVDYETLNEATFNLLDYLKDDRESLDMTVNIDGADREYYNEKEKAHMADVKALYLNASKIAIAMTIAGAAIIAFVLAKQKKNGLKLVFGGVLTGGIAALAFFAVIGVWAAIDFTNFWISFHHVFFTNDLWLLNPNTDLLIRMFEEQFFFDMVTKILVEFFGFFAGIMIASAILKRKFKNYGK